MKSKLIRTKAQKITALCLLPFLAAGALLLAKVLYARFVMPHVPPCMIRTLTGWRCPSCGMTHAVFALCRGHLIESMRENIMLMIGVLLAVCRYLELWLAALGRPKRILPRRAAFWVGILIFWGVYTVGRNLI